MFDKYELLITDPSVVAGSYALQGLQNNHTFLLDLLVRETIQNSSDAALPDAKSFIVNYNPGTFDNDALAGYFTGIDDKINARFGGRKASFLEIRDENTVGLTGITSMKDRTNDTVSNYLRLIFDMGKGQNAAGAGGRWGLGKTVCYRLGIGLVCYYSRVKTDTGFESRLVLTLIEDEAKQDAFLRTPANQSAGRAWWGESFKDANGEERFEPVKDESVIADFLDVFGIRPFGEEETGTSIIIPYIDEETLLEEAKNSMRLPDDVDIGTCTFLNSISDYLRYAVQKWYAPILNNTALKAYGKKFLNVYVNGADTPVQTEDFYPIFKLVQELYTTAYAELCGKNYGSRYPITCKEVVGSWHQVAMHFGRLAFCRINANDLNAGVNFPAPQVYMNVADKNWDAPISLYTRGLGMILNYDESWITKSTIPCESGEFVVMLFVPDTEVEYDNGDGGLIKLGEYLRQREESDHMKWDDDPPKMKKRYLNLIKTAVDKIIKAHYCPQSQSESGDSYYSEFANDLGKKFMPKKTKSRGIVTGGGNTVVRAEKKYAFSIQPGVLEPNGKIRIPFTLEIKDKTTVVVKTKIQTGVEQLDAQSWADKIGTAYPITIVSITVTSQETPNVVTIVPEGNNQVISGDVNKICGDILIEATDKKLAFAMDCQGRDK